MLWRVSDEVRPLFFVLRFKYCNQHSLNMEYGGGNGKEFYAENKSQLF